MRVIDIIPGTSVDGPGLRTAIYLAGCEHHCPGCHNPQSWAEDAGHEIPVEDILQVVKAEGFNVTLTGGDPMFQIHALPALLRGIRDMGLTVWCYTGYTYETLAANPLYAEALSLIDVLVDGPFVESLRDTTLRFRGSSNQRLIDLHLSTPGHIVEWGK